MTATIAAEQDLTVRCTYINKTKGHIFGEDPEPQVAFTNDRGRLFRDMQKEYGRCTGKVYRTLADGTNTVIGYAFEKKMKYEDHRPWSRGDCYYTREVWVEIGVVDSEPEEDDEPDAALIACIASGKHLLEHDRNGYCALCDWRD